MSIKKILVAFSLAAVLLLPNFALAASSDNYGADTAAKSADLASNKISQAGSVANLVGIVINIALSAMGVLFFVLFLYAGFMWMTAMGSAEKVTKAKDIIEAAIIGLVLVGGAYAIANFVFEKLG